MYYPHGDVPNSNSKHTQNESKSILYYYSIYKYFYGYKKSEGVVQIAVACIYVFHWKNLDNSKNKNGARLTKLIKNFSNNNSIVWKIRIHKHKVNKAFHLQ